MNRPLISVIMNCYNGEKYLHAAVESVLRQDWDRWELVFWDNCSTDRSAEIIKGYNDVRIRYILAQDHTTLGAARRLAVEACRGEFISFLDTDDEYLPGNLRQKYEAIERDCADVVYAGSIHVDSAGREIRRVVPNHNSGMLMEALLAEFEVEVPTMLIRKSAMQREALNFDDRIVGSEEYDLLLQLAVRSKFSVLHRHIAMIRQHRESLTYRVMKYWAQDRQLTVDKIRQSNPELPSSAKRALRKAEVKGQYYRSRWLVQDGKFEEARTVLRPIIFEDWRYVALYASLKISPRLWDFIHRNLRSARSS